MATERCRDVLAEQLVRYELLRMRGTRIDRIRAAIAADDAERERVRAIEAAAREVDDAHRVIKRTKNSPAMGRIMALLAHEDAHAALFVALLPPTMRQLDAEEANG